MNLQTGIGAIVRVGDGRQFSRYLAFNTINKYQPKQPSPRFCTFDAILRAFAALEERLKLSKRQEASHADMA